MKHVRNHPPGLTASPPYSPTTAATSPPSRPTTAVTAEPSSQSSFWWCIICMRILDRLVQVDRYQKHDLYCFRFSASEVGIQCLLCLYWENILLFKCKSSDFQKNCHVNDIFHCFMMTQIICKLNSWGSKWNCSRSLIWTLGDTTYIKLYNWWTLPLKWQYPKGF